MIFLLKVTVGFPVNFKQASDWDFVNVKPQYDLINILELMVIFIYLNKGRSLLSMALYCYMSEIMR